jgi:hypothetical protein
LVGWFVICLYFLVGGLLVGWLVGFLVGYIFDWLACWLVALLNCWFGGGLFVS